MKGFAKVYIVVAFPPCANSDKAVLCGEPKKYRKTLNAYSIHAFNPMCLLTTVSFVTYTILIGEDRESGREEGGRGRRAASCDRQVVQKPPQVRHGCGWSRHLPRRVFSCV